MALQNLVASTDGPRLTVAAMVKDPTVIPKIVLSMTDQQFLTDSILRDAGSAESGSVVYYQSTPLYSNDASGIVAEFGEIPATTGALGTPAVARTIKRALAMKVSQEMINRNNYGAVMIEATQIRNTLVKDWNGAFLTASLAALTGFQTYATAGSWTTGTAAQGFIRNDLSKAIQRIRLADSDTTNGTGTNKFGFVPDTLIINPVQYTSLLVGPEMQAYWVGSAATLNPIVGGDDPLQLLPVPIFGLKTYVSWQMPAGQALVLQSKVFGGYVDERPLQATPLYEWRPTETWRSDVLRQSAIFVDQPQAGMLITGLT